MAEGGNTPEAMPNDPRMRGFRSRTGVDEAIALIAGRVRALGAESIDFTQAAGRVLAARGGGERAGPPLRPGGDGRLRGPGRGDVRRLDRTTRPRSASWEPPGPATPATSRSARERRSRSRPGRPSPAGPTPSSRSNRRACEGDAVWVSEPTPPGRHVGRRGEDIAAGTVVLTAGRALRPQDLGVLSSVAARSIDVVRRPDVAVIVTGDELLPPGTPARGFQIADTNSVMLAALIARDGGIARVVGPLPDDRDRIRREIADASASADAVLISGGSSAGPEDHAPGLVAELGELAVHGVALRPASPAGIGFLGERGPRRPPAGQPRQLPLRLRLLRRPDRPPPGRPAARTGPIARPRSRWPASSSRSSAASITPGSGSCKIGSSRWRSAARRSCRARPAPTGSSSSRPTWRDTPSGRMSPSGSTTQTRPIHCGERVSSPPCETVCNLVRVAFRMSVR